MTHQRFAPEEKERVATLAATMTVEEIAEALNRSISSVRNFLHRNQIKPKPNVYHTVTRAEARRVVRLKQQGFTFNEVARLTKMKPERVKNIYYRHK